MVLLLVDELSLVLDVLISIIVELLTVNGVSCGDTCCCDCDVNCGVVDVDGDDNGFNVSLVVVVVVVCTNFNCC